MSDESTPHHSPSNEEAAAAPHRAHEPVAMPTEATDHDGRTGGEHKRGGPKRGGHHRQGRGQGRGQRQGDRPKRRDVNGWVVLDKGVGMTSTQAVGMVKRCLNAKKAGHAGTLDPLASGLLPIALGEATKTVPFVMDGRKAYVFTVTWGIETDTDDAEGNVVDRTDKVPHPADIEALLPRFTGHVMQTPPQFSAIKIAGERAYDLARDGEQVALQPRPVEIDRLTLLHHAEGKSVFEAECGKGTYVRALARDMGRENWAASAISPPCAAPASAPSRKRMPSSRRKSRRWLKSQPAPARSISAISSCPFNRPSTRSRKYPSHAMRQRA